MQKLKIDKKVIIIIIAVATFIILIISAMLVAILNSKEKDKKVNTIKLAGENNRSTEFSK